MTVSLVFFPKLARLIIHDLAVSGRTVSRMITQTHPCGDCWLDGTTLIRVLYVLHERDEKPNFLVVLFLLKKTPEFTIFF